ncbi:carboxyvinyl-carboxyphosphonate phosphorylmutase [Aphanothece hegewaldii CCALA 016]|uniref:Carboxyvinyl-carboxyphosphonate phosphorylmutase n=1 Tax=Aphanothece hegewaldii CCALA 016 TaxID=2107694 RepID=A0A2T1LYR8_9CHRO|nr:isocitrate lyase/PEP mutase family protein [Aphanothece hegewaldii]PSF37552.1 carboxyvinyl-carboxyphosphonate phosphorylmutase [Aphanothece hegewaldii CCALA 016]
MTKAPQLRLLLTQPNILVLPGVYDCISAKLALQVGFEAIFTSGFGIAASTLGVPDYGLLSASETLYTISKMAQAVSIPIIADLDTGYGNPLNVIRTVKDAVQQGISGIILEDQVFPKKCGHFEGKQVISAAEHIEKIKAARYASKNENLIIVARTDAYTSLGLTEAIARGKAYAEAGADIIFIEAPQSVDDLKACAQALPNIPLLANMIEGGKTPILSHQELQEIGFKIVVYPLSGLLAATQAILTCFEHLKKQGTTTGFSNNLSFTDFKQIIEVEKYQQLEKQFSHDKQ